MIQYRWIESNKWRTIYAIYVISFKELCIDLTQLPLQAFDMFRVRRMKVGRRTVDQEKIIAQTFVKFLEDGKRKENMFVDELRTLYQDFRVSYETLGMSFSKLLNTLTYHLNMCQQLQDRVIFGGGDAAALQLFNDDPSDDESEGEADYFSLVRPHESLYHCKVCKRDLGSQSAYSSHMAGVKHRQQYILKKIRKSLQK